MRPLVGFIGCKAHFCVPVSKIQQMSTVCWANLSTKNLYAEVAQLVERDPSKVDVAGSRPVFRSIRGSGFKVKDMLALTFRVVVKELKT